MSEKQDRIRLLTVDDEEKMDEVFDLNALGMAFPAVLGDELKLIDDLLAKQNIPIPDIALASLHRLLALGVITDVNGTALSLEPNQIVTAEWFKPLWKLLRAWYRQQYGNATQFDSKDQLVGFLLIRKTPFIFYAPTHIVRAGEVKDTAWMHLVDRVLDEENALDWISNLPAEAESSVRQIWHDEAKAVANDLRFIYNRVLSLRAVEGDELLAFARSLVPHLNQAAIMITTHKPGEIIRSYWEMQMAAEAAFKSLLLQRTGDYPYTHDLIKLSDDVTRFDSSFSAPCLTSFPHWKKTAEMRYGTGESRNWETCHRDYRCILSTIRQCLDRWKVVGLGNASFLIRGLHAL